QPGAAPFLDLEAHSAMGNPLGLVPYEQHALAADRNLHSAQPGVERGPKLYLSAVRSQRLRLKIKADEARTRAVWDADGDGGALRRVAHSGLDDKADVVRSYLPGG